MRGVGAAQIRKMMPGSVDGLADGSFQSGVAIGAERDGGAFVSVRGWSGSERGIRFHQTCVRTYNRRADLLERPICIGASTSTGDGTGAVLTERADQAMYWMKRAGRNMVAHANQYPAVPDENAAAGSEDMEIPDRSPCKAPACDERCIPRAASGQGWRRRLT